MDDDSSLEQHEMNRTLNNHSPQQILSPPQQILSHMSSQEVTNNANNQLQPPVLEHGEYTNKDNTDAQSIQYNDNAITVDKDDTPQQHKKKRRFLKNTPPEEIQKFVLCEEDVTTEQSIPNNVISLSDIYKNPHHFQFDIKKKTEEFVTFSYGCVWLSCMNDDATNLRMALACLFIPPMPITFQCHICQRNINGALVDFIWHIQSDCKNVSTMLKESIATRYLHAQPMSHYVTTQVVWMLHSTYRIKTALPVV